MVRREPDGTDVLSVKTSSRGLFGRDGYVVAETRTGSVIGSVVPIGFDWELRDASGAPVAYVGALEEGVGLVRYAAKVGEREVCRCVWGFLGATVASAELQVEFLPGVEPRFNRALAIVLGPVLEQRARRASQWRSG